MKTTDAVTCSADPPNSKTICRLEAVADTWLEGTSPKGTSNILVVGKHSGYDRKRTIIKFEDIPQCGQVVRANMYVNYLITSGGVPFISRPIEVRRLLKRWEETVATSVKRTTTEDWGVVYVGFDGIDATLQANSVETVHNGREVGGYLEWDVTLAATNWAHGNDNHGVILSASNDLDDGNDLRFRSRENGQLRPYMTVVCQN